MKNRRNDLLKKLKITFILMIFLFQIFWVSESRGFTFSQITPTDKSVTFERIIMQNKEQKELDTDGAGCQWQVSLESSNDGSLMLYGIDVAGLYKSTDHGENWVMANSGMESRGVRNVCN